MSHQSNCSQDPNHSHDHVEHEQGHTRADTDQACREKVHAHAH